MKQIVAFLLFTVSFHFNLKAQEEGTIASFKINDQPHDLAVGFPLRGKLTVVPEQWNIDTKTKTALVFKIKSMVFQINGGSPIKIVGDVIRLDDYKLIPNDMICVSDVRLERLISDKEKQNEVRGIKMSFCGSVK